MRSCRHQRLLPASELVRSTVRPPPQPHQAHGRRSGRAQQHGGRVPPGGGRCSDNVTGGASMGRRPVAAAEWKRKLTPGGWLGSGMARIRRHGVEPILRGRGAASTRPCPPPHAPATATTAGWSCGIRLNAMKGESEFPRPPVFSRHRAACVDRRELRCVRYSLRREEGVRSVRDLGSSGIWPSPGRRSALHLERVW